MKSALFTYLLQQHHQMASNDRPLISHKFHVSLPFHLLLYHPTLHLPPLFHRRRYLQSPFLLRPKHIVICQHYTLSYRADKIRRTFCPHVDTHVLLQPHFIIAGIVHHPAFLFHTALTISADRHTQKRT
jgi:hypothetical protein